MKALREAIINAVIHRDWFMDGANVFVELYPDRIEVVSPGGLPKGMTVVDLGRLDCRKDFAFDADWNGQHYAVKQLPLPDKTPGRAEEGGYWVEAPLSTGLF